MIVSALLTVIGLSASVGGGPVLLPIPAYARRENMQCGGCHTTVPRLNRFGYEYRNAGYRLPETIGEKRDFDISDMISARNQSEATLTRTKNEAAGSTTTRSRLQYVEFTVYPMTGSFGKYWSSLTELSFSSEDFWEIENAYLRGTFGKEKQHFQVRAGVFHPFEGYGASDRPAVLSRPIFQNTAATNAGTSTFFTPWGFDQVGVEAGYTYKGFNAAATLFNGIFVDPEENKAFPFQGGELSRASSDPNYNSKDVQLFANQFIGKSDAAVSAFFYHGTLTVPFGTAEGAYTDQFDRLALYGTLPIALSKKHSVWALSGVQWGWDDGVNATTGATLAKRFTSSGWFGELYSPITEAVGATARYDTFRPSADQANNRMNAFTIGGSIRAADAVQGIFEYQFKNVHTGATTSTNTNQLRARLVLII